jgi:hypothetical protein
VTTITKQWLQQTIDEMETARDDIPFGLDEHDAKVLAALKQLLAGLEQEPVAWRCEINEVDSFGGVTVHREFAENWATEGKRVFPLYLAPQPLTDAEPQFKAAVATLEHHGFTWNGGEQWKPPLGLPPAFISNDRAELEQYRKAEGEPVVNNADPRDAFEAVFTMPKHAERSGKGYACTAYSAWDAHKFVDRWDGWNACRAAMLNAQPASDKQPGETGALLQLRNLIRQRHAEWSEKTFGSVGPIGPLKHLSKEALEAAAEPDDLSEWADMQFLLWDAQRRAGICDGEITAAMEEKLKVNMAREWPEPKDGEPRLHIKTHSK